MGGGGAQHVLPCLEGEGRQNIPTGHTPFNYNRKRVSSVVEHSSANPKVPGSIPGPVSYRGHGL